MLGNRAHGQVGEYAHGPLPGRWWGALNIKFDPSVQLRS
jgi:hypothetical protein